MINYPVTQNVESGDSVYADAVNHCVNYKNYIERGDKVTSVHEITHGINSDIRNAHSASYHIVHMSGASKDVGNIVPIRWVTGGSRINAFYCLKDRAFILNEPHCKKRDAIPFVPKGLQFSRFGTYVTGQTTWDDMPYYLFDEGVAYSNGADCVIDMASRGEYKDKGNDFIFGPVEFLPYLAAVLMAADKAHSLEFDHIIFAFWHFSRVAAIYYAGRNILPWDDMEKVVAALKGNGEAKDIVTFLKDRINWEFPNA